METNEPVHGRELEAIARAQRIELTAGDALVIHCGREKWEEVHGPWGVGPHAPGVDVSCLRFLRDNDISVLVWDMMEHTPFAYDLPFTVHSAIFTYGIAFVDNASLKALSDACAEEQRYEFLLVVSPLVLVGGTGSPVNPVAVL